MFVVKNGLIFSFFGLFLTGAMTPQTKLTLKNAVERALSQNPRILAKQQQVQKAIAGRTLARAPFLPQLKAEAGYTYLDPIQEIEMNIPSPIPNAPSVSRKIPMGYHDNRKVSLSLGQNVFAWWADYDQYQAAKLGIDLASLVLEEERQNVALETAKMFYSMLLLNEQIALFERMLAQKEKHLRDVTAQFKGGLAAEFDQLQTEVSLENLKPELDAARNKLKLAELNFKNLTGIKAEDFVDLDGAIAFSPLMTTADQALASAYGKNPAIKTLSVKKEMLSRQTLAAEARDRPSLNLGGKWDYANPSNMKAEWGSGYSLFAQLSWPIFDGFVSSAQTKQLLSEKNETDYMLISVKESVSLAVRSAYLTTQNAALRRTTFERNVKLAEKAYTVAKTGFQNGTVTNSAVLDADIGLLQAKLNQLQSVYDHIMAKLDLERAMGMIIDSLSKK